MEKNNSLRSRADALVQRSTAHGVFEFRDEAAYLVGMITASDRARIGGPWLVQSALSLTDDRTFKSWTAAVFFLKALYVEALVVGRMGGDGDLPARNDSNTGISHFNPAAQSALIASPPQVGNPTEPGWYIARKKSWAVFDGPVFVKVTSGAGSADPLQVWQTGDERPWPVNDWDWKARLSGL